jgi:hypothetical protein
MASPKDRRKDMKFYTENTSIFGTPLLPSAAELEWLESNKEMKTQGDDDINYLRLALHQQTLGELP